MRTKHWIAPLLLAALAGCDDMLTETPESFLAPENFYRTAADADAAVLSTYQPLVQYPETRVRDWVARDAGSDMSHVGPLEPNPNTRVTGTLASDPGSLFVTGAWKRYYQTVTRANLAIERVPDVEMDPVRRDALVGEAKFMRALAYFYLVRLYGDVPLVTSIEQDARMPRTPAAEVFAQIIQDATDASRTLPPTRTGRDQGRPVAGSALTLLADVHLWRKEWQKAADAAKQVIDSNVFSLFPDYLHAFLPAHENGREHVFSLQANAPESRPIGTTFAAIYYPRELKIGRGGGWGMVRPTQWQFDSYIAGDYRKDVTYATRWVDVDGKVFDLYPHVVKYRPSQVTNAVWGDVNKPIYRYAEVLLMYAEALNELGRTGEAVQYLNRIRARARNADGEARSQPADYSGPMSQDAVREAIFQERNWELAHEDKRWFDLVRRGEQYFLSQIAAHDPEATDLEPKDMLWPVPQDEIDLVPLLTQNPGY